MPRKSKKLKRNIKRSDRKRKGRFLPLFLILFGLVSIVASLTHRYLRWQSLSLSREVATQLFVRQSVRPVLPAHIFIRWFVDTDIEALAFSGDSWAISADKATYLLGSAIPGEKGNIVLYGHNTRQILGNIRALKGGEQIELTLSDGNKKQYVVRELYEVEPTDTRFIGPTGKETLTIYTCSGLLDSKRFIVRAYPI